MAAWMPPPEQGRELPRDGTPCGDECIACCRRFSTRYWIGGHGPYCAACASAKTNSTLV